MRRLVGLALAGGSAWLAALGFDWWPLAARGDVVFPLGLWLLTHRIAQSRRRRRAQ